MKGILILLFTIASLSLQSQTLPFAYTTTVSYGQDTIKETTQTKIISVSNTELVFVNEGFEERVFETYTTISGNTQIKTYYSETAYWQLFSTWDGKIFRSTILIEYPYGSEINKRIYYKYRRQ